MRTWNTLRPLLLIAVCGVACAFPAGAADRSRVVAQMYVWMQHFGERGLRVEDHLHEAFAATARAGSTEVQGWLSWFTTPERAAATGAALAAHRLRMSTAYADGPLGMPGFAKIAGMEAHTRRWAQPHGGQPNTKIHSALRVSTGALARRRVMGT